jgi:hypothetical protein
MATPALRVKRIYNFEQLDRGNNPRTLDLDLIFCLPVPLTFGIWISEGFFRTDFFGC